MTIATEFGNFGSFKDLSIFMHLEGKASVFISSIEILAVTVFVVILT